MRESDQPLKPKTENMNEVQGDESKREEHRQMSDLKGLFQRK